MSCKATYETANTNVEQSKFLRYDNARKVQSTWFDHTNGTATGYAERLNGSANEKYGIARSISVMPGDKINAEVYAKFVDTNSNNWTSALNTLLSQIASGTASAGTFIDGAGYSSSTSSFSFAGLIDKTGASTTGPKAYLNWLVFDRNYMLLTGGYKKMSDVAKEYGQDIAHEYLASPDINITQPGYVYIYLSNEESTQVEVYFDDLKVTQVKSPVIQQADYYAFGLAFNSYSRENSVGNQYLYNGKENQDELDLGWVDYGARIYLSEIGRWNSIDLAADMFDNESPYSYGANNPINVVDVGGYFRISAEFATKYPTLAKMIANYLPLLKTNHTVKNAWMNLTKGTSDQFDEMVTYRNGPEIVPTQPENSSIWNQNDDASSTDSHFTPKHPDKIFIAPESLQDLEVEMKKVFNGQDNDLGAQMFFVALTIMHEATHYGVFKYRGEDAFWRIEGNAGPWGGDQGAHWEGRAYKRFSYRDGKRNPPDRSEVFKYYKGNYSEEKMRGMTLHSEFYYNHFMLMGQTQVEKPAKDSNDAPKPKPNSLHP